MWGQLTVTLPETPHSPVGPQKLLTAPLTVFPKPSLSHLDSREPSLLGRSLFPHSLQQVQDFGVPQRDKEGVHLLLCMLPHPSHTAPFLPFGGEGPGMQYFCQKLFPCHEYVNKCCQIMVAANEICCWHRLPAARQGCVYCTGTRLPLPGDPGIGGHRGLLRGVPTPAAVATPPVEKTPSQMASKFLLAQESAEMPRGTVGTCLGL